MEDDYYKGSSPQFLTPEMVKRLIGPDVGMQQGEIEHQRALAAALRQPGIHHTTGLGGTLGAIAQGINGFQSAKGEQDAQAAHDALMQQDLAQRQAALEALQGMGMAPSQTAPTMDFTGDAGVDPQSAALIAALRKKNPAQQQPPMDDEPEGVAEGEGGGY